MVHVKDKAKKSSDPSDSGRLSRQDNYNIQILAQTERNMNWEVKEVYQRPIMTPGISVVPEVIVLGLWDIITGFIFIGLILPL